MVNQEFLTLPENSVLTKQNYSTQNKNGEFFGVECGCGQEGSVYESQDGMTYWVCEDKFHKSEKPKVIASGESEYKRYYTESQH